ncbi:MAG TPA: hypothetical protein VHR45_08950 [Thermoanaerobaculia bacterium]|nr:hypothetical protein [Thermoanaerobaculia bacterium]
MRLERATLADLEDFRGRVVEAKTARSKSGDVGAALLVARAFTAEALAARPESASASGRWTLGIEETFTGYEGFVRVGPRRGFHFMLVQETDSGFEPLLP